jgi:hypothetical protein
LPDRISLSPSTASSISCSIAHPILDCSRLMDKVRIWLILSQDFFGREGQLSSSVSGNPGEHWVGPNAP